MQLEDAGSRSVKRRGGHIALDDGASVHAVCGVRRGATGGHAASWRHQQHAALHHTHGRSAA